LVNDVACGQGLITRKQRDLQLQLNSPVYSDYDIRDICEN